MPLISIISVVYNDCTNMEHTMKSVLGQTFSDYEYIIIDGGSTDGTLNIVDRYKNEKTRIISERDKGIYDAMNKGIGLARGGWIIFLNAGDTFLNVFTLEKVSVQLQTSIDSDLIFGDVLLVHPDGSEEERELKNSLSFLIRNMVCHQCIFYSVDTFRKVGLFNLSYPLTADFDHFLRIRRQGLVIKKISEVISRYSMAGVSAQKENIHKIWKERLAIFNEKPRKLGRWISLVFYGYACLAYKFRKHF